MLARVLPLVGVLLVIPAADEGYGSYGTGGGYGGILDTRGGPGSGITIIPVGSPVVCRVPNRGLIGRSNRFPFSRGIAVRR